MRMAEEFERCKKCGEGWFEKRERVMVQKDSPTQWGEPLLYKAEVDLVCIKCQHIQYKYNANNY